MLETVFPSIALKRAQTRRMIAEELAARNAAVALDKAILESLPVFARDNDEGEWSTSTSGREPLDYSSNDLDTMLSSMLELSYHPGARGLLDTMESFTIGESMYIIAQDENPTVQEYWDDWAKANKWDIRCKECFRRFLRDGEFFLRWFPPLKPTAAGYKQLLTRFVEPNEIKDPANRFGWGNWTFGIETNPEDVEEIVAYYRQWYYTRKDDTTSEERWERIEAAEIDHFKCLVDSNVKRGRSWLMGNAKYIRMHEQWIDQRFQLNRLRNLFAVVGNIKGMGDISTVKSKFTDTTGKTLSGEGTPKKMPSNALMLLQKGIEWDLKSLNINATDAAEDGRNIQLLICAGTGLAEYVVRGTAENSAYASTMVAESPMVRMFQKYQDIWRDIQGTIFARVIRYGINQGDIPATSTRTKEGMKRNTQRAMRYALREGRTHLIESLSYKLHLIEAMPKDKSQTVPTSVECQVEFPPLIHRDIEAETRALTMQRNNGWVSDPTCSSALGYDYAKEKAEIDGADADAKAKAKQDDHDNWS